MSTRAQSILFACSENAIRSPMAEFLARRRLARSVHIESAGVRPGETNPFTTSVLAELGLDSSDHEPRVFADLDDWSFDLIVTLSPEAHHRALEVTRSMAVEVIYWPTFDPTAVEGSRDTMLEAFRTVRDSLDQRIERDIAPLCGSE